MTSPKKLFAWRWLGSQKWGKKKKKERAQAPWWKLQGFYQSFKNIFEDVTEEKKKCDNLLFGFFSFSASIPINQTIMWLHFPVDPWRCLMLTSFLCCLSVLERQVTYLHMPSRTCTFPPRRSSWWAAKFLKGNNSWTGLIYCATSCKWRLVRGWWLGKIITAVVVPPPKIMHPDK